MSSSSLSYGGGIAAALGAPFVMTIGFLVWEDHWKGSAFALNLFKCCFASIGFLMVSLIVQKTTSSSNNLFSSEIYTTTAVGYLMLSSTIGILIGDWAWLKALKLLGSRRVIIMDALKPFLAAFFGWWLLDEDLRVAAIGGIALTVCGIVTVSFEQTADEKETTDEPSKTESTKEEELDATVEMRCSSLMTGIADVDDIESNDTNCSTNIDVGEETEQVFSQSSSSLEMASPASNLAVTDPVASPDGEALEEDCRIKKPSAIRARRTRVGYAMSVLNVVLDTYGAVLIKQYGADMSVWSINLIRFGFAGLVMFALSLAFTVRAHFGRTTSTAASEDEEKALSWYALPLLQMTRMSWLRVSAGVVLVTFLTPALSNYALFQIALGLALTLGSTGPLYQLPLSYFMQKQVLSVRSLIGAVLAVAGIVVLAFWGTLPS